MHIDEFASTNILRFIRDFSSFVMFLCILQHMHRKDTKIVVYQFLLYINTHS